MPATSEQAVIDALVSAVPARPGALRLGPGDDAAVLPDGTALTVDALTEGVHWDERLEPADVGYKVVAVSASDLGAMGARPEWMVLAVSLPSPLDMVWVEALAAGVAEAAERFAVTLAGGDVTGSQGPRWVSVTMGGPCPRPVTRAGATPGQDLWLTGWPGLAGAGWALSNPPGECLEALRRPRPPVALGQELAARGLATAMMDLSDGLGLDLPRLCRASGIGALVHPDRLPVHPALAGAVDDPLPLQVGAGDDYGLLFTAAPEHAEAIAALAGGRGVRLACVGHTDDSGEARLEGRDWPPSFTHFGS